MSVTESIKEKFKIDVVERSKKKFYAEVNKKDLLKVAEYLFKDLDYRFVIASGIDTPVDMEILYHFSDDRTGEIYTLVVHLDKKDLEVESLRPMFIGAEWIEREMHELLGINFKNNPKQGQRLLLDDTFPKGKYPLRRDYKHDGK